MVVEDDMKAFAVSVFLASGCLLGLSAPALAQAPNPPPRDAAADTSQAPDAAADNPDALVDDALTPEARIKLLVKCSGPPPRPVEAKATPKPTPATPIPAKAEKPTG